VVQLKLFSMGALFLSTIVGTAASFAADRVALVIGNGAYQKYRPFLIRLATQPTLVELWNG
jgi:hypothetical protein